MVSGEEEEEEEATVAPDEPSQPSQPLPVNEAVKAQQDRTHKQIVVKGFDTFRDNPSSGIKYFVQHGFCEMTPESVAKFLHEFPGLSKNSIGQYLGRSKDFNKSVLHEFTTFFNFKTATYIEAIRMFLNAFRLPGEACMIDPIMEKFAESYYKDGVEVEVFKNADAAYVLSYSIMMLNTDLHHPEVKERMTETQFKNNLRGVNDGGDLDPDFLSGIYHSINDDEIKLKDDDIAWYNLEGNTATTTSDPKMRAQRWEQESKNAIQKMKATMDAKSKKAEYHSASHHEHVRPMFEVSRWPFLSGFSQYLEQTGDQQVCILCLDGFKAAIHISCIFYMATERDAFITSLSKFTQVTNP